MATYNGDNGNNILTGGRADDVINGYGGHDILTGGGGNDGIVGGPGHDILTGGGGNDGIGGGPGTDFIIGNQGDDWLEGGPDADIIWGGNGNDVIIGGPGDDTIYGGTGDDILFGGPGRDTFVFNSNQPGVDTIMDFEYGDRIDVRGVDGFFDPDEESEFSYGDVPANSPFGQRLNEILSDIGIEARFVGGVAVVGAHIIGENQFDRTRHVAIYLNGVSESTLNDGDYLGSETLFGSGWIVNPDYFA